MLNPALLEAVRAEISEHEAAIAKLRDVERLVSELVSPALPANPPEPRPEAEPRVLPAAPARQTRPRTAPRPREEVKERRRLILSTLSTRGPLSPVQIAEALGEPVSTVKSSLYALVRSEEIEAQGTTSNRTYDVRRNGHSAAAPLPVSRRVAKEVERENSTAPAALEDEILNVVRRLGGRVKLSEIEFQLRKKGVGFDRGELGRAVLRLETHTLVTRDAGGGLQLAERPVEAALLDAAGVDSL